MSEEIPAELHNCTCEAAAAEEGGSKVFENDTVRVFPLTIIVICLIIFTVLFEYLLHKLEHALRQYETYLKMLSHVYKELMILGFISFGLLLVTQFTPDLTENAIHSFDFAHVWIFVLAMMFVFHAAVSMLISKGARLYWDRCDKLSESTMLKELEANPLKERFWLWRWLWPVPHRCADLEFHVIKNWFLFQQNLPVSFPFAAYLRVCMQSHTVSKLEVKPSSWIVLIVLMLPNLAHGTDPYDPEVLLWFTLFFGVALFALHFLMMVGVRVMKERLLALAGNKDHTYKQMTQILIQQREKLMAKLKENPNPGFLPDLGHKKEGGAGHHDHGDHELDQAVNFAKKGLTNVVGILGAATKGVAGLAKGVIKRRGSKGGPGDITPSHSTEDLKTPHSAGSGTNGHAAATGGGASPAEAKSPHSLPPVAEAKEEAHGHGGGHEAAGLGQSPAEAKSPHSDGQSSPHAEGHSPKHGEEEEADDEDLEVGQKAPQEAVKGIFPFGAEKFWFFFLDMMTLIHALYLALAVILLSKTAVETWGDGAGAVWVVVVFGMQALNLVWIEPQAARNYVFVKSMGHLHHRNLEETMDALQESHDLRREIAEAIQSRYPKEEDVRRAFSQYAKSKQGAMTTDELCKAMMEVGIRLPKERLERLLIEIDDSGNGTLEIDEFMGLAFTPLLYDPDAPRDKLHELEQELEALHSIPELAGHVSEHRAHVEHIEREEKEKELEKVEAKWHVRHVQIRQRYIRCFEGVQPQRSLACKLCGLTVASKQASEHAAFCQRLEPLRSPTGAAIALPPSFGGAAAGGANGVSPSVSRHESQRQPQPQPQPAATYRTSATTVVLPGDDDASEVGMAVTFHPELALPKH